MTAPDREIVIAATVAALRAGAVPGIVDAIAEGGGAVRVHAAERNATFSVALPPVNPPAGLAAAVTAEWDRQRRRLSMAASAAATAQTHPCADLAPAVRTVALEKDGRTMRATVAMPWTERQRAALAELERAERERAELAELARGPADVIVRIPIDGDGRPDLDAADLPAGDVRAAVAAALESRPAS